MAYLPLLLLYLSLGLGLAVGFMEEIEAPHHWKTGHLGIKISICLMFLTSTLILPLAMAYHYGVNYTVYPPED